MASSCAASCTAAEHHQKRRLGRPTCAAARQPQTEVPAASLGEVASVSLGRLTRRAPLPHCPPAASPLPTSTVVTGSAECCSDAELLVSPPRALASLPLTAGTGCAISSACSHHNEPTRLV